MTTQIIIKQAHQGNWLNVLGMEIQFLSTKNDTDGRHSSMLNTVPKGLGAPLHSHPWDESFYILKGEVELTVVDTKYHLSEGDYALVPANKIHSFSGLSDSEALMLLNECPSHSHAFFQEINDTVTTLPDDLAKMPSIGKRHQVSFY